VKITTRNVNDTTVVDVSGRLDTLTSGPATEEMTRIAKENYNVLVNLENLEFLGSAGLRVLLRAAKHLDASGGKLKICNATGKAKQVIDISGLDKILDLHDSESSALAAF
jgi:anti-sigma B factor antagonist